MKPNLNIVIYCVILFAVFSDFFICAQEKAPGNIDSLTALLDHQKDEEKIKTYNILAKEHLSVSPEKSIEYAEDALELSEKTGDKEGEANALYNIAEAYYYNYDDQQALEYYNKALHVQKELGDNAKTSDILRSIGMIYMFLNDQEQAKTHFFDALNYAKEAKDKEKQAAVMISLGRFYDRMDSNKIALNYYRKAQGIYSKINDEEGLANAYNMIASLFLAGSKYDSAAYLFEKSLEIRRQHESKEKVGVTLIRLGNVYIKWAKYEKALTIYQEALDIFNKIEYAMGIASCLNNIGLIYESLERTQLAIEYHKRALEQNRRIGRPKDIANSLNNLGNNYVQLAQDSLKKEYGADWIKDITDKNVAKNIPELQKALNYYTRSLDIRKDINDQGGVASSLNNLGIFYKNCGDYNKAVDFYKQALEINEKIDNQGEVVVNLHAIGEVYLLMERYDEALEYLYQSLKMAEEYNFLNTMKELSEKISKVYAKKNNYEKALEYYMQFSSIKDSILNKESLKIIQELQTKYETEKKEQALELQEIQINKQKMTIYFFIGGFLIILLFSVFLYRQIRLTEKANKKLEEKNELITEQKKEITDSIQYASRIQSAILPPMDFVSELLEEYFILFKPRDIVSGDYYYINESDGKAIVVAADCTGHGVPGAFMSMLGIAFLNEIISQKKDMHANTILNELRDHVIKSLHQVKDSGGSQDGMDLALYIVDYKNMKMEFAGANNPLIMIRDNEIIQTKGDSMPIGIHDRAGQSFTNHEIELKKGDRFYTFSDGYQDQFGGPKGKKFMIKNMKNIFLDIHQKPMKEQREILDNTIEDWMKDTEQIDDIILIGIKV